MGLGRYKRGSGMGAAKWLIRHGAQTIITDLKDEEELEESMSLVMEWYEKYRNEYPERTIYQPIFVLGEHRKDDFVDADCVVQNPGVPSESEFVQEARKNGVAIESDVSLFFRYCPFPTIAVTGTKGKTTTTKMLGEMLKKQHPEAVIAGNINTSPLEFLDDLLKNGEEIPIVLELSSWMLESLPGVFQELGRGPQVSVVTNVFPDHLNRYESFGDYVASKSIIFQYQANDQFTVLNYDQETTRLMSADAHAHLFWASKITQEGNGCYVKENGRIALMQDGTEIDVIARNEVALKGEHNLENVLTSIAAALLYGIDLSHVQETLKTFVGVSDRQELVREVDEITYINDTTATNPGAVIVALKTFGADGDIVLIAGGVDKVNGEYSELADEIMKTCKHVVLFDGDASEAIEKAIAGRVPVSHATSMEEAVTGAKAVSATGDIVLLSPGAASFNMFQNEFDRGEQFREEVRKL